MADLRTEEEQIEAIKSWWKKNGNSILLGVGIALAVVFGWQAWQKHQTNQRAGAANAFSSLIESARQPSTEENQATLTYRAEQIRSDYPKTGYAIYASMLLAHQQMMDQDDPKAAQASLEWALERVEKGSSLALLVRTRLGRAQFAAGDYDAALATVRDASSETGTFTSLLNELEGDILMAKGDRDAALEAYLRARDASGDDRLGLLQLKLADLGVGGDA